MKKLIAILLTAVMFVGVLTLSGCKDDAGNGSYNSAELYALVNESMEKTQAVKTYSAVMTQTVKQNLMGVASETSAVFTIQAMMKDPSKPIIGMDGNISMGGQEMSMAYYYDGTWMYYSMLGNGYKMRATLEDFQENAGGMDEVFADLPEDLFDGVTAKVENGVTKVELTADSEEFKAMYDELMGELFNDVLGDDTSAVVVDDVKIVITLDDNYVKTYDMSFKCSYTIGSDSVSFEVVQSIVFESINEEITITPPEGYEDFPELDAG